MQHKFQSWTNVLSLVQQTLQRLTIKGTKVCQNNQQLCAGLMHLLQLGLSYLSVI